MWQVAEETCEKGSIKLTKELRMVCKNNAWKPVEKRKKNLHGKPKAAPCVDAKDEGYCKAQKGHCSQYTDKGTEMDRDCSGTCGKIVNF